jgi:hypothetical protein
VNSLLSIDSEIVLVIGAPVGNAIPIQRGFDSTPIAAHATGATVSGFVDAWHHNSLVSEVEAIETFLGINGQNAYPFIISKPYNFSAQPGGVLAVGNNTITLAPVPFGVNGSDANHYLYISGGTGTPEAVLIAGGTAISGTSSGTVIVSCASTHTGTWTISSATAGIQEALNLLPAGGGWVVVPAGNNVTYAKITLPKDNIMLTGVGLGSIIQPTGGSFDCLYANNTHYTIIANLQIAGSGMTGTVWALNLQSVAQFVIEDIKIISMPNGINLVGSIIVHLNRLTINNCSNGYGVNITGGGDTALENMVMDNSGTYAYAGICIAATGGTFISNCDIIHCSNGLLVNPATGANVVALFVESCYFDSGGDGISITPASTGSGGAPAVSIVYFTDCWVSSNSGHGVILGGTGSMRNVFFSHLIAFGSGNEGVLIQATAGPVQISDSVIGSNSQTTAGAANNINVVFADDFVIVDNVIGGPIWTLTEKAAYAISVGGASSNFSIVGNALYAGTAGTLNDTSTGIDKSIANNRGASYSFPTIASAATITVPTMHPDAVFLSGTTAITTISGGYQGAKITFLKTDTGTISFNTGGNIASAVTLAQNGRVDCIYNASYSLWFLK